MEPRLPAQAAVIVKAEVVAGAAGIAPADEARADTKRLQAAFDRCPVGQAVELAADGERNAFVAGALDLRAGVTLMVDKGVTLFASRNPKDFDGGAGRCGTVDARGRGCRALLNGDSVDHAAVVGEGIVDGQGGAMLTVGKISWWDLAQQAKRSNQNQNVPRILNLNRCNDFTLYRITLRNSANFHVSYSHGRGFTVWGVVIESPKTARNTDGIDPGNSEDVTITGSVIKTGDDQVAIKAGAGAATGHMTIAHNHFYTGHGMSIGSETDGGADHILVSDLSIDGAENGLRIKSNTSRGGLVHDVTYEDVCIRNTANPLFFNTHYSFYGDIRDKLPEFRDITLRNISIESGKQMTFDGFDGAHPLGIALNKVMLSGGMPKVVMRHARLRLGPGEVNLPVEGDDVIVSDFREPAVAGSGTACASKFLPFAEAVASR